MSFRKNILRISFLVLGFLLTLAYFGAPGPRAKPQPLTQKNIVDPEFISNTTNQLSEEQLIALEDELSDKIGFSINRVVAASEFDEFIIQKNPDRLSSNKDAVPASIKPQALEKHEKDRQVIYFDDDSTALAARLVIGTSQLNEATKQEQVAEIILEDQNNLRIEKHPNPTKQRERKKEALAVAIPSKRGTRRIKSPIIKDVSKTQQNSDLVLENLKLREKILITRLLSDIDSNITEISANHIDNNSVYLQEVTSVADAKSVPLTTNVINSSRVESTLLNTQSILRTQSGAGLRIGPGMQYILLTVLDEGLAVQANYNQGNWVNVTTKDGITAWLPARYLKN